MATIYKATIISHWQAYSKEDLEKILNDAVRKVEFSKGNTIQIEIDERE